jgi:SAM-dependent methyltransferase
MCTELKQVDCPICGCNNSADFAFQDGFKIVRCNICGLVYVNPRRDVQAISEFFAQEYINSQERVEVDFISYREASLRREASLIKKLYPQGGRLLDVGAASGFFLNQFSGDPKWQVEGVEPSSYSTQYAREKFGLTVHQGFLIDQQFPKNSFEVIICADTFCFMPNPNEELSEMARILKPGGLLALEIPGFFFRMTKNRGLLCRLLYGEPVRLNPALHLFFYSRKTLTQLVERHGFKFMSSFPEQSPIYGSLARRILNNSYFTLSSMLYYLTYGKLNIASKEFIIYQKENG